MFGKVKKWLGIEGVKIELVLPDFGFKEIESLSGKIQFYSKNEQKVTSVKVFLVEKYTRGRGKEKRIDEYRLGEIEINESFIVPAEEILEIDFHLPFSIEKSEMDEFEEKNFLTGGIAKLAKKISNVQSEYYVEAEAIVEGVALNPFDKQPIEMK